ncbi:hypothetical protein SAMN05421870_11592 [Streptomyces qinglanensis]|uniref:Uncharacterized protein n=1 Tax=Streptomyces qinglanensis TaxID=943816 RepID=A0A1H9W6D8_9ACTN|nr:hypothetical protein SAMN05421870_11592 [Streptomyces qinglanensis]
MRRPCGAGSEPTRSRACSDRESVRLLLAVPAGGPATGGTRRAAGHSPGSRRAPRAPGGTPLPYCSDPRRQNWAVYGRDELG